MNAALLQILVPVGIAVLGAGWAIIRYELNRYAKSHPNAPIVKTAETVIAEAKAVAPLVGITGPKVAGFISGALAAQGHVVPAKAILATEEAIQAAANADLARVPPAAPASPAGPAASAGSAGIATGGFSGATVGIPTNGPVPPQSGSAGPTAPAQA